MKNLTKTTQIAALSLSALLASHSLLAGTCEVQYTRTACPGKEELSYKKCEGEQSCSEFIEVADAAACKDEAMKACENQRTNITKSKVIKALLDGTAVTTDSGKADFCEEYPKRATEFNQC